MTEQELENYLSGMADYQDGKLAKDNQSSFYASGYGTQYELAARLSSGEYYE